MADVTQIERIIDKVAEKLNVAADKLQPLGEELVRQVSLAGWAQGIASAILVIISAILFYLFIRKAYEVADAGKDPVGEVIGVVACGVVLIVCVGLSVQGLMQAVAPLAYLVGK